MRNSTVDVRNRVLDQLKIEPDLRAYAMEHLWTNNMVGTDGDLTKLGRFAADMGPTDPENAALLWYGHHLNVLREAIVIYTVVTRGATFVKAKVKALFPHPGGDFHTMINVWNAAEWTYHQTKNWNIEDEIQNQQMIKVWGKLNVTRRSFLMLKEHQNLVIEKCCKLLGTTTERVLC